MAASSTVSITSSSPISKLTEDILWLIFTINTDNLAWFYQVDQEELDDEPIPLPLNIARRTSQVCQEWRQILLRTSSIWGRLMDWRSLNQETDHWRDEVLRRSGTSLLWLRGYADEDEWEDMKCSTSEFFRRLVDEHWERIQRISVSPTEGHYIEGVHIPAQRAAPNLESFTFFESSSDYHEFQGLMFAGHAPRLKIFRATDMHCNLEAAWMSNIRELSLGHLFNNKEVCNVLPHMPRLEFLEFQRHLIIDGYCSPPICLPNLRTMRIWGSISYLHDIEPAPGCSLRLDLWNDHNLNIDVLRSYTNQITKIIHNYISFHSTKRLYLDCTSMFIVNDRQFSQHIDRTDRPNSFEIRLCSRPDFFDDIVEHALEMLPSSLVTTITDFMLDCIILQPQLCHAFRKFTLKFQSLNHLWFHGHVIPVLLQLQDGMSARHLAIFPELKRLTVLSLDFKSHNIHSPRQSHLERFVSLRRDLGVPITTLDLTEFHGRLHRDLRFLEGFVGMKVRWERDGNAVEYECGSGQPECLRFS